MKMYTTVPFLLLFATCSCLNPFQRIGELLGTNLRTCYKECSSEKCSAMCFGDLSRTKCTNKECASTCLGAKCRSECDAERCQAGCTGDTCFASCNGDGCKSPSAGGKSTATCKGISCEAKCSGDHCSASCEGKHCKAECHGVRCRAHCQGDKCQRILKHTIRNHRQEKEPIVSRMYNKFKSLLSLGNLRNRKVYVAIL